MRVALPAAVLLLGIVCGPAFADGDDSSAMQQLQDATSGSQPTGQTFDGCNGPCAPSDAYPQGDVNVPEPSPPEPVDTDNTNSNGDADTSGDDQN